jgi:hypothetical protein
MGGRVLMPEDIKVPGIGDVPKKYAIGAVAVAAGLGVIVYIRSRNAAQSAAAAGASAAAAPDTSGTDPNAIDPATGIPYSEESGAYSYGPDNYGGYGGGGYDNSGYPIGSAADLQYQAEQVSGIQTNDEWVQQAMGGSVPGDPATIQAALSGVLGGLTVTTAQKNLFLEAVGILGNPPQGYPTPVKTSDTAAHPGTPVTAAQVTVPNVKGQPQEAAYAIISEAGLKPSGTPVVHGRTLIVQSQSPAAGAKAAKGSAVHLVSKVQ